MILGSVDVGEYYGVEGVEDGDSCITHGGFTDIEAGAQVTVLSADGTKLAVGDLQTGFIADSTCRFAFEVDGIPEGESLYDITVGREARGSVTYAREKLNETVRLVL